MAIAKSRLKVVCGYIVVHTSVKVAVWVYTHYGSSGKRCGTFPLWRLKRNTKNSVMSSKEKRRKKSFPFSFFLGINKKSRSVTNFSTTRTERKEPIMAAEGGEIFLHTTDDERTGRPSWTREESYSFGVAQTKMPKSQAKRERKNI